MKPDEPAPLPPYIDPEHPPAPIPELGEPGEEGEAGHGHHAGHGGHGGRGGRGGIGIQGPPGPATDKQSTFDKYALAVVVTLTAISAIFFAAQASGKLSDAETLIARGAEQQQQTTRTIACQQDVVEDIAQALKARTVFAQQQAEASIVLHKAQKVYLDLVTLRPPGTDADALAALNGYVRALDFNIQAAVEAMRIRDRKPYPTQERIESCLR